MSALCKYCVEEKNGFYTIYGCMLRNTLKESVLDLWPLLAPRRGSWDPSQVQSDSPGPSTYLTNGQL